MLPTIYLCGPIADRTTEDCTGWRNEVKDLWKGKCLDPMRRDYRGRQYDPSIAREIVEHDLTDIDGSDALLVYFDRPSVGTSMEVFYASHVLDMPVVIVNVSGKPLSPWLIVHSLHQVSNIPHALRLLEKVLP